MIKREWNLRQAKLSQRLNNKKLYDYGINNPVKNLYEVIDMKIKVEKSVKLEDGKYTGVITGVEYRDEPFDYTDVIIKEDKTELELKCGMPTKITEDTMLGLFLLNFNVTLKLDAQIDVEEIVVDKKVEFMVINKKTDKGSFCNILPTSVKPVK